MRRVAMCLAAVFAMSFSAPASAQDDLRDRRLKSRVLQRGALSGSIRNRTVKVAGNKSMSINALAAKALKRHRGVASKLKAARRGLLRGATSSEEAIDTADATVLVATVKAVVTDPSLVGSQVPELADIKARRTVKGRASQLRGQSLTAFNALKTRLAREPANHPLRVAMNSGDDALLQALAAGKGELEITTTVAVPKDGPTIQAGSLMIPPVDALTGFRYGAGKTPLRLPGGKAVLPLEEYMRVLSEPNEPDPEPVTVTTGPMKDVHKTLLGKTVKGGWEWEEKWTFSVATVKMSAGMTYGLGIRIPLRIATKLKPGSVERTAKNDLDKEFSIEVTPKIFNADDTFYKEAGIAANLREDGKELVLNASLYFNVTGKADLYFTKPRISLGKTFAVSQDQHFKPPFGNCNTGTRCGFDIWLPPYQLANVGVVRGDVSVGFNVAGKGELSMDVQAWIDDQERMSKHGGKSRKTHSVTWSREKTKTFKATIAKMVKTKTKRYGYRLSNFEYEWDMTAIPALKAGVTVDLGVWDHRFNMGPYYFDFIELPLGNAKFRTHDGAKKIFKRAKKGKKKFTKVN